MNSYLRQTECRENWLYMYVFSLCLKVIKFVLQLQTYPGADISFARFPKRCLHEHHPHEQASTEILYGQLRGFRSHSYGTTRKPDETIQLGARSNCAHEGKLLSRK